MVHISPSPQHPLKLTQRQAAGGKGRGEVYSQSVGQRLEIHLGRLGGRCRPLYCRSPAGLHTVRPLWTEAWSVLSERAPGLDPPLHQGWEHFVWHCE